MKGDKDVDYWTTYVGQGAARFYLPLNVQLPNDFFSQFVVVTKGQEQRERVKAKLEQALATEFPNVVGRVYPLELGLPVGWPLRPYRTCATADADCSRSMPADRLGPIARNPPLSRPQIIVLDRAEAKCQVGNKMNSGDNPLYRQL